MSIAQAESYERRPLPEQQASKTRRSPTTPSRYCHSATQSRPCTTMITGPANVRRRVPELQGRTPQASHIVTKTWHLDGRHAALRPELCEFASCRKHATSGIAPPAKLKTLTTASRL